MASQSQTEFCIKSLEEMSALSSRHRKELAAFFAATQHRGNDKLVEVTRELHMLEQRNQDLLKEIEEMKRETAHETATLTSRHRVELSELFAALQQRAITQLRELVSDLHAVGQQKQALRKANEELKRELAEMRRELDSRMNMQVPSAPLNMKNLKNKYNQQRSEFRKSIYYLQKEAKYSDGVIQMMQLALKRRQELDKAALEGRSTDETSQLRAIRRSLESDVEANMTQRRMISALKEANDAAGRDLIQSHLALSQSVAGGAQDMAALVEGEGRGQLPDTRRLGARSDEQ